MRYKTVLWDFDGTLVDTSPGIMESIRYACKELGKPIPDIETLRKFIGPPLYESFQAYTGYTPGEAEKATGLFRQYYLEGGVYHSAIYPGLPELLEQLCGKGVKNAVTTLKPENTAKLLLDHFHIAQYFKLCKGVSPYKMKDLTKTELIRFALEKLRASRAKTVMIGDTAFDEEGARECGVDFVAAAYGFGFTTRPDCVYYAQNVESLGNFLL